MILISLLERLSRFALVQGSYKIWQIPVEISRRPVKIILDIIKKVAAQ